MAEKHSPATPPAHDGMKIVVSKNGPYLVSGGIPLIREEICNDDEGYSRTMVATSELIPVTAPVLSNEIVDTIGAGDAYLAITSLLAKNGNPPDEIAFIGNAIGAMAVQILGNKSFIEKIPLLKYIRTLLT